MYLLQYRLLKRKMECEIKKVREFTEARIYVLRIKFIFCSIFLLAILLGCIWGYTKLDNFHWYDTKVIGSFVVLFVYCTGLYLRAADVLQGKKIVQWNIGSFLVMLVNIFLLSSLSNFHFWYL